MFTSVTFERRNGQPVYIQPRHVAAFEPLTGAGVQGVMTRLELASGTVHELIDPPSAVESKLRRGN